MEKIRRSAPRLISALLGTTAVVALGAFLGGCENPTAQADKTVNKQVQTAEARNTAAPDRKVLVGALDAATKVPNASPAAKVNVKLEEARQELDAADAAARHAGSDEIELARLAGQVQSLTGQISANNLLVMGLKDRDPSKAPPNPDNKQPPPVSPLQAVDDAVAAAKGSGATATWGAPDKGVPAASAVDAKITQINAEIQKLTTERTALDSQQKQNNEDARKLEEQAAKTHGTEARDAGIKAAGLRRDARNASARMDQIDRAVAGLKDEQKVQEVSKTALAEANKAFQDRKAQINAGWEELKKQIDAYQDQSKRLLEGSGEAALAQTTTKSAVPSTQPKTFDAANPPSDDELAAAMRDANVTRLGTLIQAELGKYDTNRQNALDKYEAAYSLTQEAQGLADQVVKGLPKLVSEKEAAKGLAELFGPGDFKLKLAGIRLKEAQVHDDQADTVSVLDNTRTALSAALEKAGLTMPAPFTSLPPGTTVAELRKKSDDEYSQADATLEEIVQGAGNTTRAKNDEIYARQMEVAERYARAKDAARSGDTAKAETQLTTARNLLQALNQDNPVSDNFYLTPELASAIRTAPKLGPLGASGPTFGPTTAPVTSGMFGQSTAPADFVEHAVPAAGFSIKTPPSWQPGPLIGGTSLVLTIPEHLGASINVVVKPLEPSTTLESVVTQFPAALKAQIPGFQSLITSDATSKVGAYPAAHFVYDATALGKSLQFEQFLIIQGQNTYWITFTALSQDFAAAEPVVKQAIDTFTVTGSASGAAGATTAPASPDGATTAPATPDSGATPPATPPPDTGTPPATPATPATPAPDAGTTPPATPATPTTTPAP